MDVARLVNLVSAGVVTGASLMELAVLMPALRSISFATLVDANRAIGPRAARLVPIPGALATFSAVIASFQHDFDDTAAILTIAGLATWVAAILTTYFAYLPIVTAMTRWDAAGAAGEHAPTLRRWAVVHAFRTALFAAGFCLFAAAAIAA
jgi:hypothetical protein